jgi:hypothetical protein
MLPGVKTQILEESRVSCAIQRRVKSESSKKPSSAAFVGARLNSSARYISDQSASTNYTLRIGMSPESRRGCLKPAMSIR